MLSTKQFLDKILTPGVFSNSAWLILEKVIRLPIGLILSVALVRYLGADKFGLFSFCAASVAITAEISELGINEIVKRDIIQIPENTPEILRVSRLLLGLGGLLAFIIANLIGFASAGISNNHQVIPLVFVLSIPLIFKWSEVGRYYFEVKLLAKVLTKIKISCFVLFSILKICLIILGGSILQLAFLTSFELLLVNLSTYCTYLANVKNTKKFVRQKVSIRTLLQESFPLLISGTAVLLYFNIDQFMLGWMTGPASVGIYSAASRLSEAYYFIGISINSSFAPVLLESYKVSSRLFIKEYTKNFKIVIQVALVCSLFFSCISPVLIPTLYGYEFNASISVFQVHVWSGLFVFINNASWTWFVAKNMQLHAMNKLVIALCINVVLNLLLIPFYGPLGAAMATLISRSYGAFWGLALVAKTRPLFLLILGSIEKSIFVGKILLCLQKQSTSSSASNSK